MRTMRWVGLALTVAVVGCGSADDDGIGANSEDVIDGVTEGSPEALAVLALVNDPAVTFAELDDAAKLDRRAAENIIEHRDGADATVRTEDDDLFETVGELDAVSFVGTRAFEKLLAYAEANGYLADQLAKESEVVFSPQPYENSHNVRVRELIDGATQSIDVAMYSFSDAEISAALDRAVQRGVQVRFIFETANKDRRADNPDNTKSGNLEEIGVDVRYVNKIMHHKYMIVDGPRDDAALAKTAWIATGSGNWSWGRRDGLRREHALHEGLSGARDADAGRVQSHVDALT